MLHTRFHGHRPFGPEKKDFYGFYHIWAAWRPSWSCDQDRLNKLSFPHPREALYDLTLFGPVVSEEKMFKECGRPTDRRRTDGRRRPTYPINSLTSLRLR